jgi:hypothetical protein
MASSQFGPSTTVFTAKVGCVWNVMAHAQKPDFVFRLNGKRTSLFKSAGGVGSVDYWQASCTHQPAGFALLVQACVLQSCDTYWLPTPFYCFPFTSPLVRHTVCHHISNAVYLWWELWEIDKTAAVQSAFSVQQTITSLHGVNTSYSLSLLISAKKKKLPCSFAMSLYART